jgi:hypothetical protein
MNAKNMEANILIREIAADLNETITSFRKETSERVALIIIIFKN